jgi:AcrR family transcriptional regulator
VGRPKEHDEDTRVALSAAAERLVAEGGPEALTVRATAGAADTTTRAVYSLFGSKEGLVDALAERAFELLHAGLDELPETDEPAADLVEVGVGVFRAFVLEHPSLFRLAFQRIVPGLRAGPEVTEARQRTLARLEARIQRVAHAGLLADTRYAMRPCSSTPCAKDWPTPSCAPGRCGSFPKATRNAHGATASSPSFEAFAHRRATRRQARC